MCQLLDIRKTRTVPYHPQSDGVVERFNRALISMLLMYVKENHSDWDIHLPKVMLAYRSSVHETTKFAPYYILFGRDIRLPIDVAFNLPGDSAKDLPSYVSDLKKKLVEMHEHVRDKTSNEQKR